LAMRRLLLILFTIAVLIGLPRLANEFRQDAASPALGPSGTLSGTASREEQADGKRPRASAAALQNNGTPFRPPSAVALSVSLKPADVPAANNGAAALMPANQGELVSAIQKELKRLGYYDGPIGVTWSRPVRVAARNFTRHFEGRVRNPWPTVKFLEALRAIHPEGAREVNRDVPQLNLQTAEPVRSPPRDKAAIAIPADMTSSSAEGDSYLPPWERTKAAPYRVAVKPDTAATVDYPRRLASIAEQKVSRRGWAESPRHIRRRYRHERVRARRLYASAGESRIFGSIFGFSGGP
jgi:hypothetical protein